MPRESKSDTIRRHARKRFYDRIGVDLTNQLHDDIVLGIQSNRYRMVDRQSNRITVWEVPINNDTVRVVYDKSRKLLVTVMTEDSVIYGRSMY